MTTDLISLDTLKNLNLDFKVSKNDILDILIEQLRENIEEEVERTEKEWKEAAHNFNKSYETEQNQHYDEQLKKVEEDPKVHAVKKTLEDLTGNPVKVERVGCEGYYTLIADWGPSNGSHVYTAPAMPMVIMDNNNCGHMNVNPVRYSVYSTNKQLIELRTHKIIPFIETDELKEQQKTVKEKYNIFLTVSNKLNDFNINANRMKTKVLKQFLAGTEEGNKLLNLIDKSRTGKQLVKAINTTSE